MYRKYEESKLLGLTCPLCDSVAKGVSHSRIASDPTIPVTLIVCGVCGQFRYDSDLDAYLESLVSSRPRYKISHAMRSVSEKALSGEKSNSLFPIYSHSDFQEILDRPDPSIQQKMQMLLKYLARLTDYPGEIAEFDGSNDYSVLCAKNAHEADFYIRSLYKQGLIGLEDPFIGRSAPRFTISTDGWEELDRIDQQGSESSNAFIAMSFHPDREPFEKAISEAIRSAGYVPIRVDRIEHVNRIDDEIIARIRGSKFLIADFTSQRNGVYFEAGFMLGLGRTVIWVCEKSDLKNVHFDARQYNTIDYADADDLRTRLQFRIEAVIGSGPNMRISR